MTPERDWISLSKREEAVMRLFRAFLGGAFAVGILAATTFSAAADNIIFRNPSLGLSFYGPSDWTIEEADVTPSYVYYQLWSPDRRALCGFHSMVSELETSAEFAEWLIAGTAEQFEGTGSSQRVLSQRRIETKSGVEGVEVLAEIAVGGRSKRRYFVHDAVGHVVDCETYTADWERFSPDFDTILSTFNIEEPN